MSAIQSPTLKKSDSEARCSDANVGHERQNLHSTASHDGTPRINIECGKRRMDSNVCMYSYSLIIVSSSLLLIIIQRFRAANLNDFPKKKRLRFMMSEHNAIVFNTIIVL